MKIPTCPLSQLIEEIREEIEADEKAVEGKAGTLVYIQKEVAKLREKIELRKKQVAALTDPTTTPTGDKADPA